MKNKLKLKKGDKVVVITGKDKGKKGDILKVIPDERRIIVSGINLRKRHVKPNRAYPEGGIVQFEGPIHASNVMICDPKLDMPARVGYKLLADGKKVRFSKKSGEELSA